MSHISWVMTANDAEKVPMPFLNRCTVIELQRIGLLDLCTFARAETARLRGVIRMIERAEVLERRPRLK